GAAIALAAASTASSRLVASTTTVLDTCPGRRRSHVKPEVTIESVGEVVVARMRGEPTIELLEECQERVLTAAREAGKARVLYDALAMTAPPVDVPWSQRTLDER